MNGRTSLVAACFALTAMSYGLGRFAFGLFLPDISEDLSLDASVAGWIGGGAFASYCIGIVVSMCLGSRASERTMAVLAGGLATCGLAVAAAAPSVWYMGAAMMLAGLGTGLTSPPLTAVVERHLGASMRPKANGAINAGTAVGIVFSGIAMLALPLDWRQLFALFAATGAAVTAWVWVAVPAPTGPRPTRLSLSGALLPRSSWRLCASACLMGAGSTAVWTFGATIMRDELGFADDRVTLAWVVLGAAGVVGTATGFLTQRHGLHRIHRLALCLMAAAVASLSIGSLWPAVAFPALASFGAAYIVSSGAFLLWGIRLYAGRPAYGLGVPFLTLAAGQAVGAPIVGAILGSVGSTAALVSSAAVIASAAAWSPIADEPHES